MAKVDIWMPIYIGDYLGDTTELSGPEHGAYLLLLMHYWMKHGEIGCDIERLARACRSDVETCRFILGSYFTLEEGNYKNKRADNEMKNAENRRLASSENGKKGGRPSKNNLEKTHSFSVGIPRHNLDHNLQKSSSSSSSSSSSQEREEEEPGKPVHPQAVALSTLLFTLHQEQDPKYNVSQSQLANWSRDIEKIARLDGRDYDEIERVLRWAKADGFWRSNIMSGNKLREKFPTLYAQMTSNRQSSKPLPVHTRTTFLDMED